MNLDRVKSPPVQPVKGLSFLPVAERRLKNGAACYWIESGAQEVARIELILEAGKRFQGESLTASTVLRTLREGTRQHSALELSELIDGLGAFIQVEFDHDIATVVLFVPTKQIEAALRLFAEIILEPTFPEQEVGIYLAKTKQSFEVESQKGSALVRRKLPEVLFGSDHPYGSPIRLEDFSQVSQDHLTSFYQKHYHLGNGFFVLAGRIPEKVHGLMDELFGQTPLPEKVSMAYQAPRPNAERYHEIDLPDALQTAIRIGCPLFTKTHEDYFGIQVTSTILGGYFGSRLMSNIREDKGYTYGIGSAVASLMNDGFFFLATEVGADVAQAARKEIYFEIDRLQQDLVPEAELDLVRNYLLGQFLRNADGAFAQADRFTGVHLYGLDYSHYDDFVAQVRGISAQQIRDLAQKYWSRDRMFEVIAGKL